MWSSDFEIADGEWFGDWLHAEIAANAHIERTGFMPDRIRAAAARLQADRPADEQFVGVVPWLSSFTAFTAPGKYFYFSRRLLERCPHEESAAFVVAHEIAHHDLRHLDHFSGPFARHAARLDAGKVAILFFRMLQKRIYSPEWELAADRRAIDLCLKADYDVARCLYFFHILETIALDYGDLKMVFGLDPESDQELSAEASVVTKARIWLYSRERGYLPIQDRRAELMRYIGDKHGLHGIRPQGA